MGDLGRQLRGRGGPGDRVEVDRPRELLHQEGALLGAQLEQVEVVFSNELVGFEHGGFGFNTADAPTNHAQSIDHGGM